MYDDIDIYPYRRAGESSGDQFKEVGKKRFGFKPKINKAMIKQAFTARWLFLYIMAFFLGRAMLLGELMPFGIAFVAAMTKVSGSKSLGVLFFALLGLATVSGGLALVSSGLVMLAVYLFLCRLRIVWQREWYIGPGAVLIIVLIIKCSFTAYAAGVAYDYISVLFEAVFAGVLTLAFIHAIPPLWQRTAPECINKEALFCILLLFGGVVAGTGAIEWGLVSLRGLVSNLIILLAALLGGAGLGAAAGAMIGVIPGLSYVLVSVLIGAYSFAGLMAGLLRRFGRFGVAAGFLLGNIILSIYVTDYGNMLGVLLEAALAIVLFCLIPAGWLEHIAKTLPLPRDIKLYQPALPQAQVKEMTAKRMLDWAKVFTELAGNFKQASATVEDYQEEKSLEQLFEKVGQKVCRGCALYRTCWEREFHQTYQRILNLLADVETNGALTVADLPENLQKRCDRLKEMVIAITCLHDNFKLNNYWQKKLLDSRQLVSEQLQGISEIMINMSGELAKEIETAGKLEAEITKRLKRAGITVTDLFTFHQQDGRLEISLTSPGCEGQLVCHQKIATIITAVAGQQLVLAHTGCCRHAGQQECTLKFYSALNYRLAVGSASVAQGGNAISGDTYTTIQLKDGKYALLLSDGMGVGRSAYIESSTTIKLLECLLRSGFEKDMAVKTVNSILVLRAPHESFATIDMAVLDLYSGRADFIKICAAASFLISRGRVTVIKSNSLPVGIVEEIEVTTQTKTLQAGDILIMLTDGMLDVYRGIKNQEKWFEAILPDLTGLHPQEIADVIMQVINTNGGKGRHSPDDRTVLVAKVENA